MGEPVQHESQCPKNDQVAVIHRESAGLHDGIGKVFNEPVIDNLGTEIVSNRDLPVEDGVLFRTSRFKRYYYVTDPHQRQRLLHRLPQPTAGVLGNTAGSSGCTTGAGSSVALPHHPFHLPILLLLLRLAAVALLRVLIALMVLLRLLVAMELVRLLAVVTLLRLLITVALPRMLAAVVFRDTIEAETPSLTLLALPSSRRSEYYVLLD